MAILHDESKKTLNRRAALLCLALLCAWLYQPAAESVRADTVQTSIIISICGNGIIDPGELCDDGLASNTGAYASSTGQRVCSPDCMSYGPYCGDGILQVRFTEQCDDGNTNGSGGLCSAQCLSLPAVPPSTPSTVVGGTPFVPGATPGTIPAITQTQVILRGKAYPNSEVSILLDGKALGTAHADSNADFLFNSTSISPGTETFSFLAKDSGGVSSLTMSVVFDVVQSAVTTVNNIFLPPTLSLSGSKVAPGDFLTLFGQSVPKSKVVTSLDSDNSGALAANADNNGNWAFQLDTASIAGGFHSVKTSFILSTSSKSGFGKSENFFVGNQLPTGGTSPDVNGDSKVNLVDFSIFLLSWNTHDVRNDFNQDGTVNLADFSIMLFNWTG